MKSIDIYFEIKKKYADYIIMYKMGNFYNVFGDDSHIIGALLGYKINSNNNVLKVGFPLISQEKVLKVLNKEKINYIILEKEDGIINIKIKKRYITNSYNYFSRDTQSFCEIKNRIEKINSKLNSKINEKNIDNILKQIENII
ncbi:MAG: hypothetical protein PHD02_02990 [Bacilli bacterium]|nr:hypothetical protein [Bacilli bacterium]